MKQIHFTIPKTKDGKPVPEWDRGKFLAFIEALYHVWGDKGVRAARGPGFSGRDGEPIMAELTEAEIIELFNLPFLPGDRHLRPVRMDCHQSPRQCSALHCPPLLSSPLLSPPLPSSPLLSLHPLPSPPLPSPPLLTLPLNPAPLPGP